MSYKSWLVKFLPDLAEILATQQLNPVAKLVPAPDHESPSSSPVALNSCPVTSRALCALLARRLAFYLLNGPLVSLFKPKPVHSVLA